MVAALVGCGVTSPAHACECPEDEASPDVIFSGMVTDRRALDEQTDVLTILTSYHWKGEAQPVMHVQLPNRPDCRLPLVQGERGMFYVMEADGIFHTNPCLGSMAYEDAIEARTELGEPLKRHIPCL